VISDHRRKSVDLGDDEATLVVLSALVVIQDIEPGDERRKGAWRIAPSDVPICTGPRVS